MPHNILVVSNICGEHGGNFIKTQEILQNEILAQKGDICFVFPEKARGREWLKNLKSVYFSNFKYSGWKELYKEIYKEHQFKIVHFNFFDDVQDVILSRPSSAYKAKIIYHCHMRIPFYNSFKYLVKKILYTFAYRDSLCICVSNAVCADAKHFHKNSIVIKNSIDFGRLDKFNKQDLISKNDINLLIFGNFWHTKGVDIAIKATALAKEKINNIKLNITCDKSRLNDLKECIKACTDDESFINILPSEELIATYYRACDIFLSPSRHEALSYAVLEATYCGCNVIATNIPGQNENKIPNIYWISDPNKENDVYIELADKIIEALNDKQTSYHNKKVEENKKWLLKNCDLENWANQIIEKYNSL